jgi:MATE family multidrug resistance protein
MSYAYQYRRTMILAVPVILSQLGQVTVNLVDTIMIGHVGTTELAAASFANNVFLFGMLFGMGITFGFTPVVGEAFSKGQSSQMASWLKNGLLSHALLAVLITVFLLIFYLLLPYMGQTDDVVRLAGPYYLLLCASYIPFLLFFSVKQFLEGMGNTKYAMQITIASNVVNIVVNYVLIFGKFGFPEMGLIGAGIGTLVARVIMPLMWVGHILWRPVLKKYFYEAFTKNLEWSRIKKLLSVGVPIAFQIIIEISAFSIGAIMMGWIGETELAGHQVAIGLAGATFMICLGISQATTIRVSHQKGLNEWKSIKTVAFSSTHLVLLFMSMTALIFIFGRNYLPFIFSTDEAVIAIAARLLIIAGFFQLFDGLQVIMLSVLRGLSDVNIPTLFALFSYVLIALPVSYLFAFTLGMGPNGIWYGYLVGLGFAGIAYFLRFKSLLKKMQKHTKE